MFNSWQTPIPNRDRKGAGPEFIMNFNNFNQGRPIMKNFWLYATLLTFCTALGLAQTTQELVNDGKNTENVLTQSMGSTPRSFGRPKKTITPNSKPLLPI